MDLLRYSKDSAAQKIPDWTAGETFFSLDGGANSIGGFSRGATIDGFQAGHWKHGESRGVLSPFLNKGERWGVSELDRRVLDAIGWDHAPQLSKNVAGLMLSINWNTSDPDLRMIENLLKAHLSQEMEKLRQQRDAIQSWDSKVWSELKAAADDEFQKRQQGIQETLNKIRVEKNYPDKRMEVAIKQASDQLEALSALSKVYQDKLQPSLAGQINSWLNGSSQDLKNNLKNATLLQLRTLATKVSNSGVQRSALENQIKEALKLLYQETYGYQYPSQVELDTALAKLLKAASPDAGYGWGGGWKYWQTGDTKSSFDKTGEFTFHTTAQEFDSASKSESAKNKVILALVTLFGIGLLKLRGKSRCNTQA